MAIIGFDTTISPNVPGSPKKAYTATTLVAVNSNQALCDVLDIRSFRMLAVKPPVGVTSLTIYACNVNNGTFVLVNDLGSSGVVTLTASVWTSLDWTKLAPHHFIQMKSAGANGNAVVVVST